MRFFIFVGLLFAALLFAACGGDDEASTTPAPTAKPTTASTPTPAPASLTGKWDLAITSTEVQFELTTPPYTDVGYTSHCPGDLTQSGSDVSGTVLCAVPSPAHFVSTGTIDGASFSFTGFANDLVSSGLSYVYLDITNAELSDDACTFTGEYRLEVGRPGTDPDTTDDYPADTSSLGYMSGTVLGTRTDGEGGCPTPEPTPATTG